MTAKLLPVLKPASHLRAARLNFDERLAQSGVQLSARAIDTLQVNVGRLCNQACKHCHVDAGPSRTEVMERETAEHILVAMRKFRIPTLDVTGGAPELNPSFRYLVGEARRMGAHVIVRHNLTVIFETGQQDLPEFFREHTVEVVSSLPYYLAEQTDAQRGRGVFDKSIIALRRLNSLGYGIDGSGLVLNLAYNPTGAFLPPSQAAMEADFKHEMMSRYGVSFNSLYTITNMPINRFLDYLRRSGNEQRYMTRLADSFNPRAVAGLMCRTLINVDWRGRLYDCDFNQMAGLGVEEGVPQTIAEFDPEKLAARKIRTAKHCFGCTAGAGSSCGGALASGE